MIIIIQFPNKVVGMKRNWLKLSLGLFLLFFFYSAYSLDFTQKEPLSVEQAFQVTAHAAPDNQGIITHWEIAEGSYLYPERIQIKLLSPKTVQIGKPELPPPQMHREVSGQSIPIYGQSMEIPIPVSGSAHDVTLEISYQGCSSQGYCYPPVTKNLIVNLGGGKTIPPKSHSAEKRLLSQNLFMVILGFFGLGLLLAFTPCVLPMIPILSGIIVGHGKITTLHAFLLSIAYVIGMAVTYAVAGLFFGLLGNTIQASLQKPWVIGFFSLVFVAMAFSLFGMFQFQPPEKWRGYFAHLSNRTKHGTLIGTAVMGCLSTLILSPCVTPALVGVLGYISETGNAAFGAVALFCMALGMGAPLLIISTLGIKLLPKTGAWMNTAKNVVGILLLGVAILMLQRILPSGLTMILWASLAIGVAIYCGALSTAQSGWHLLKKGLGLILFIYGVVLVVAASFGNSNPLKPLSLQACTFHAAEGQSFFIPIKNIRELNEQLTTAQQQNKLVMLDFSAKWCTSCAEMQENVFSNPQVKSQLSSFMRLQADITVNNNEDKLLQKSLSVVAPPTIVFFKDGKEIPNTRIIGRITTQKFLSHLIALNNQLGEE